jgi:hypothetical protein
MPNFPRGKDIPRDMNTWYWADYTIFTSQARASREEQECQGLQQLVDSEETEKHRSRLPRNVERLIE